MTLPDVKIWLVTWLIYFGIGVLLMITGNGPGKSDK